MADSHLDDLARHLDELLGAVIRWAPELQERGVLRVQVDGLSFELAQKDPPPAGEEDEKLQAETDYGDPLDDPTLYGRGGFVPGFPRQKVPDKR